MCMWSTRSLYVGVAGPPAVPREQPVFVASAATNLVWVTSAWLSYPHHPPFPHLPNPSVLAPQLKGLSPCKHPAPRLLFPLLQIGQKQGREGGWNQHGRGVGQPLSCVAQAPTALTDNDKHRCHYGEGANKAKPSLTFVLLSLSQPHTLSIPVFVAVFF